MGGNFYHKEALTSALTGGYKLFVCACMCVCVCVPEGEHMHVCGYGKHIGVRSLICVVALKKEPVKQMKKRCGDREGS